MNTKAIGDIGEHIAASYLLKCGYKILETNAVVCGVEIDIICEKKGTYVFVEVKTRTNFKFGRPMEAVVKSKQMRYHRAAEAYIVYHHLHGKDVRFDVIEVLDDEINHIENAF